MTQPPDDHLKALWKDQPTETAPMSAEAIRLRAADYQARTRRRFIIKLTACILAAAYFLGYVVWLSPNGIMRAGWGICAVAAVWMAFQLRGRWPAALPRDDASATALLDYHRALVLRQKLRVPSLVVAIGPMMLGVLVAVAGLAVRAGPAPLANWAPIGALFVVWLVAFWFVLRRQNRRLERELAELESRGSANP